MNTFASKLYIYRSPSKQRDIIGVVAKSRNDVDNRIVLSLRRSFSGNYESLEHRGVGICQCAGLEIPPVLRQVPCECRLVLGQGSSAVDEVSTGRFDPSPLGSNRISVKLNPFLFVVHDTRANERQKFHLVA